MAVTSLFFLSVTAPAAAQAPPAGPLVLLLPASPRAASLGNAWVAGRDQDVLFYNPAQLVNARTGLELALGRYGNDGSSFALGSIYAAGKWSLTLGWGVQMASFQAQPPAAYPYPPDVLLSSGTATGTSTLAAVGGAIAYKGFRLGAAGKYAADRVVRGGVIAPVHLSVLVADVGVARNLFGGVAAFSAQNLGRRSLQDDARPTVPRQVLMGWSIAKPAGPLDLALYSQVLVRDGWTSPGAGLDVGYSWIEGCVISLRAGARRSESDAERPYAFGGALTIDRVSVEYSVQFFDEGRHAHGVTMRWR
jgi:hypothetical protein